MLAKKTVPGERKSLIRDKEAKIGLIVDATRTLVESMGYEKVTIRDIAESAGVSIGLIYKYFPGGKFDIIKWIGTRYMDDQFMLKQPETIDFNDFPGYMRAIIKNMRQLFNDNISLTKALTVAAQIDGEILDEVKKIDIKDYNAISEFFGRFNGVEIGYKNSVELLMNWGFMVKGILLYSTLFPVYIKDEEALVDLLVDLSLRIWGYQKP